MKKLDATQMINTQAGLPSCARLILAGAGTGLLGGWVGGPHVAIVATLGGAIIGAAGCFD